MASWRLLPASLKRIYLAWCLGGVMGMPLVSLGLPRVLWGFLGDREVTWSTLRVAMEKKEQQQKSALLGP